MQPSSEVFGCNDPYTSKNRPTSVLPGGGNHQGLTIKRHDGASPPSGRRKVSSEPRSKVSKIDCP